MSSYQNEILLEQKAIQLRIDTLVEQLQNDSSLFDELYPQIASLRIDLQAKKDREYHLKTRITYVPDTMQSNVVFATK